MIPPQPPNQGNDLKLDGLTRQELKKIQKSMKRPEFMGLLNQYMVEISDPKNKAEYDQYLRQMEREGQLPKHMKLAKLNPQFCFKTSIISSRNKQHQMKFFVNMCSSEYVEKPSCEQGRGENGGVGYNWKVPNSIGKIRYDQDKEKNVCQVVDCAFHPDTFHFAKHPSFQAMIISIAIEGAEKQLGERKQTLSRDYVILKNLKCKGQNNQPALMPIRYIDGKAYNRGQGPAEPQRNLQGKQTKLQKEINKRKQQFEQQKQKTKETKQKQQTKQKQDEIEDLDDNKEKQLIQDLDKGIQAPKFTSIYTYKTDYSQFIDGPVVKKARTLPNIFTVQFKVPRMENISQANTLEINDKKIILAVQGKYYIDISFEEMKIKNYPLKYNQAKAKFDKKKKTLRVQIPVDISSIPEQQLQQTTQNKYDQTNNLIQQIKQDVVEDEVWKNKILEVPQPQQTSKFLPKAQTEQQSKTQKKLIQQIDQDDYLQETEQQRQIDDDEIKQKNIVQIYENKKFSIRDYYPKPRISQVLIQKHSKVDLLSFVFKQTKKYLTIMIYMRNYADQQVKVGFNQYKGQFALLWQNSNTQPAAIHISITQNYQKQIKSIQILSRVGYYALVVHKLQQTLWGETSIKNFLNNQTKYTIQQTLTVLNQINTASDKIKQQKQTIEEQIRQQKESKKQNQKLAKDVNKQEQKRDKSNISNTQSHLEQIDENINSLKTKNQVQINKQLKQKNGELGLFQKLPVQFIKFNVPFIQGLN